MAWRESVQKWNAGQLTVIWVGIVFLSVVSMLIGSEVADTGVRNDIMSWVLTGAFLIGVLPVALVLFGLLLTWTWFAGKPRR